MAEREKNSYESECRRAELLGLPMPLREDFFTANTVLAEEAQGESYEQMERMSGGLDELNATLDSTRKKLTRLQSFYRRVGTFFPTKSVKLKTPTSHLQYQNNADLTGAEQGQSSPRNRVEHADRSLDKLDSLLMKAERAEMSLKSNNRLIKKIAKR